MALSLPFLFGLLLVMGWGTVWLKEKASRKLEPSEAPASDQPLAISDYVFRLQREAHALHQRRSTVALERHQLQQSFDLRSYLAKSLAKSADDALRRNLPETALSKRAEALDYERQVADLKPRLAAKDSRLATLDSDIAAVEAKVNEAFDRTDEADDRLDLANDSKRVRELVYGTAGEAAFASIDRLERLADLAEGEADALQLGAVDPVTRAIEELGRAKPA